MDLFQVLLKLITALVQSVEQFRMTFHHGIIAATDVE